MVTDKMTADAEKDVFLCYAWEDKQRADDLYDALVAAGLTVIDDAAEGLEIGLGPGDPATRAADAIRRWIAALGPGAEAAGASA